MRRRSVQERRAVEGNGPVSETYSASEKKHGFQPLGSANSAVKQMIFGLNSARLYRINLKAAENTPMPAYNADRLAQLKRDYELAEKEPSNIRYGYVRAG
jgi:hypothetical protein